MIDYFCYVSFLCFCFYSSGQTANIHKKNLLIFGGNGFIGAETVTRLIKENHKVTIINRGHWYWDSSERVKPFVRHVKCDRMASLGDCQPFVEFIKEGGENVFFDAVIDFSGYHPFAVRDMMSVMGKRIGLYIYISTDSIYDVTANKTHSGPTREEDAIEATNSDDVADDEEYGARKFACEKVLAQALAIGGPPYIIVRLPDVIGPRDSTKRWWIYQLWIKLGLYLDKHLQIPTFLLDTPMSLVYVNDVAVMLAKLIHADADIHNQAYNLAFTETITLPVLLQQIQEFLKIRDAELPINSSNKTIYMYPSVKRGPIDITKAQKLLHWSPTPIEKAIKTTIQFYEDAMRNPDYLVPRTEIVKILTGYLSDDQTGKQIARGVYYEYGIDLYRRKDEF